VFAGQLAVLLQGQAAVSPGAAEADGAADGAASAEEGADGGAAAAPAKPETLNRYDAVVGSDIRSPEVLGRGFLAVVSIDRVAG
jgi:hypothetical protein